jgi:uncharacterized phage protein (TIGR01671 family)
MNNRFKFRVWWKYAKRWESNVVIERDGTLNMDDYGLCELSQEEYVVQQYTGLEDKNGKEIYEGDIVRVTWEDNNPYGYSPEEWDENEETIVVAYDAPSFNLKQRFGDGGQICIQNFQREVIGNIFENPELLGKKSLD